MYIQWISALAITYTGDLIGSWTTVEKRAVVSRTFISHKRSVINWGFVNGNPFAVTDDEINETEVKRILCLLVHLLCKTNICFKIEANKMKLFQWVSRRIKLTKFLFQRFRWGGFMEGILIGRALGRLNPQNFILLQERGKTTLGGLSWNRCFWGVFPARAGHKTEFYSLRWGLQLKGWKSGGSQVVSNVCRRGGGGGTVCKNKRTRDE